MQCGIFNLNCVKDNQRLYENGLILHLVRENLAREKSRFSYKYKSSVRRYSAVQYFILPQCSAVRYKVLVMAVKKHKVA